MPYIFPFSFWLFLQYYKISSFPFANLHVVLLCRKDTFSIQCCDLGELTKVKVRHDNSGSGPSWLLDGVEVKWEGPEKEKAGGGGGGSGRNGSEAEKVWRFPCGQWLEVCGGCGGKLEVELEVGGPSTEDSPLEKDKGKDISQLLYVISHIYYRCIYICNVDYLKFDVCVYFMSAYR